jgi:LuxR family transcriptional regulator of spore coat protein
MKPLTDRELSCLQWAAQGKTSWEVGRILGLTERTINFHIHNACKKLGVHGRQAAITAALQAGLLSLPSARPPRPSGIRRPPLQEIRRD